jgi:hypothetical protein
VHASQSSLDAQGGQMFVIWSGILWQALFTTLARKMYNVFLFH